MIRASGMLNKVVENTVILYRRDSWVVTGATLKVLEGFHHRAARRIAGMTARCAEEGEWYYPLVAYVMEAAGMCTINEYIQRQQDTIAEKVARWIIYEM